MKHLLISKKYTRSQYWLATGLNTLALLIVIGSVFAQVYATTSYTNGLSDSFSIFLLIAASLCLVFLCVTGIIIIMRRLRDIDLKQSYKVAFWIMYLISHITPIINIVGPLVITIGLGSIPSNYFSTKDDSYNA